METKRKTIRDFKTGTLFLTGFGILILIMLTIGAIAWQQANLLSKQTELLYNHPLQVRTALGSFETRINAIHRDMRGLMLVDNAAELEDLLNKLKVSEAAAFQQLEILEDQYLGSDEDIKLLHEEFVQWNSIREETIRLLRQGNREEAVDRTKPDGAGGAQAQRLFEQTKVVDDFAVNKAEEFFTNAQEMKKTLNRRLLMLLVVVVVFSVVLAGVLIRIITQPLKELARAVNSFRAGDKAARSKYRSINQFGTLSDSFNEMAEALETESRIESSTAQLSSIMLNEVDARLFSRNLLTELLRQTNSQMGAVYLLNKEQTLFERYSCIGMEAEGCRSFSATQPEGEFGLALATPGISHIQDIPPDSRFNFVTAIGNFKPRELITIPIYNDKQAVALIAIFSLQCYSAVHLRVIRNVFDTLTARMNGILYHQQVMEFSQQLEEQNRELDAQSKELTAMAEELKEQNAELEVQKYQLGEVSRLKSDFLSNMSHELRTPLNSVIALSGVLHRRLAHKIGEEEYSYLGVIERNGKHLLSLINDVLDLSRIEAGKVELEKSKFEITALLEDVIAMIQPQAGIKDVGLTLKTEAASTTVESDYSKCFHIFQNIIGNAVKFTEKGNVEIAVSEGDGQIEIQIRDTGVGIHQADLPYIFDEFRQADGSNSRKFEGTGLGLSIAKKYADLIHCSIQVSSELEKGSVFTVSIPLSAGFNASDTDELHMQFRNAAPLPVAKPQGAGKTILLVEDTEAMIIQICDVLHAEGYEVDIARNGFEALDKLEEKIPDAMILDIMMPGMDGIELLNTIRGKTETAWLPVLVLTAKILSKEEKESIKNNHIRQLIQKGKITQDSLLEAIASLLSGTDKYDGIRQKAEGPGVMS